MNIVASMKEVLGREKEMDSIGTRCEELSPCQLRYGDIGNRKLASELAAGYQGRSCDFNHR
eukprot:scaffold105319_cov28-Tisochrysis_lutea.AAC.2